MPSFRYDLCLKSSSYPQQQPWFSLITSENKLWQGFPFFIAGVAKVLLREPEVVREPVFVARRKFSECKGMWPAQACHRSFSSKLKKIEKNWKERGPKNKKNVFSWFVRKYHFIILLLKVTPICCFTTFLARADPRGSCTIPSVVGKRIQLISHALLVQEKHFLSTSALVSNLLGSRATVGHPSSSLGQCKSHRNWFRFSLFLSAFPTVFFKTTRSIPSNIYQSFSRLRLFIFLNFMWIFFILLMPPFSLRIVFNFFNHFSFHQR